MIPILYEATEKEFKTNGLGRLGDAILCNVTQERNGQYDLELQYPVTGRHYADIKHERLILALPEDGAKTQPFEIYSISEPINGIVTVLARHISYRLKELTVSPFEAETASDAMQAIQSHIIGENPFTFSTDKTTQAHMKVDVPVAARSILGGMSGSVLDVYGGGDYEFDRFNVKLWKARGHDRGVTIRYGKDLTDSERESDIDGVYTSVVPYWQGQADSESGEQHDVIVIGDKIESGHAGDYAVQKCVPLDLSSDYQSAPTKEQLNKKAATYMKNNTPWEPSISMEIGFIPLGKTLEYADMKSVEHVQLCDTVTVEARGFTTKARVIKTVYNVLREMYDSVELGDPRTTFAQTATSDSATRSDLSEAVQNVTQATNSAIQDASDRLNEMIQNSNGLYCTKQEQDDGSTIYLLHDKPTLTESTNVIKLTSDAIGFSTDGGQTYPYGLAINGEVVANLLSAHGINADWINAGTLRSTNGNFTLDMNTGDLSVTQLSIHGQSADDVIQSEAEKAASGKSKVWSEQPKPPYHEDDLWMAGLDSDIKICKQTRLDGDFNEADWEKYDKYISQAEIDAYDEELNQEEVFKKLTNNGDPKKQGIYIQDGNVYVNASYIKTGTLDLNMLKLAGTICGIMQGQGSTASGNTTDGIVMYGNGVDSRNSKVAKPPYIIVTNAGIRGQSDSTYNFNMSSWEFDVIGSIVAKKDGNGKHGDVYARNGYRLGTNDYEAVRYSSGQMWIGNTGFTNVFLQGSPLYLNESGLQTYARGNWDFSDATISNISIPLQNGYSYSTKECDWVSINGYWVLAHNPTSGGGSSSPAKVESGTVSISTSANTANHVHVYFDNSYTSTPAVTATATSIKPETIKSVTVAKVDTYGCDIYLVRTDNTSPTTVNWIACGT